MATQDHGSGAPTARARAIPWRGIADGCGLLALLALLATLLAGGWQHWDLRLWDGSWYFQWARGIASSLTFPSFDNAPVYCAYYAIFHLLLDDAFAIFFAHYTCMLVLIGLLGYLLYRRLTSAAVALLAIAYLLVLLPADGLGEYAVRPFVLVPLLLACHAALARSRRGDALMLLAYALAAGVRPEFGISWPLLALLLWLLRRRQNRDRPAGSRRERVTRTALVVVTAAAGVLVVWLSAGSGARSWLAFGQHYGTSYAALHRLGVDPFLHWQEYLQRSFGDARSIGQALLSNPGAFFEHVAFNTRLLPPAVASALRPSWYRAGEGGWWSLPPLLLFALVLVAGGLLIRRERPAWGALVDRYGRLAAVLVAALVSTLAGALAIAPRSFHLSSLRLLALLLTALVLQLAVGRRLRGPIQLVAVGLIALLALIAMPSPFATPRQRLIVPLVRALDRLPLDRRYGLVADSSTSFCAYAARRNCRPIELLWNKTPPKDVEAFLRNNHVRVIVFAPRFAREVPAAWRAYLQRIIAAPDHLGWRVGGRSPNHTLLWLPVEGG